MYHSIAIFGSMMYNIYIRDEDVKTAHKLAEKTSSNNRIRKQFLASVLRHEKKLGHYLR